jgi:sterol desaturase/sphingolipid hydroxylase (fatty acid hydroxylase superfamily)
VVNLIALAIPVFFIGIGIELWVAKRRGVKVYRLGDAMADMGCGILQQVTTMLYVPLLALAYGWLYEHARITTLPTWAGWVLAFVGIDFVYYWWHRLSHEVNFMWAAHVVHHQSEDYNLAVALRQSITTSLTYFPFQAVLAIAGVPLIPMAVAASLSTLYQFWIHTELVRSLGPLEKVINTPALHRVHHAINPKYLDRNHGATLILWDRFFGTYQPEEEECVYGITQPLSSFNSVWAQFDHYWNLVKLTGQAPGLVEKVKVWVMSPAWKPAWYKGVVFPSLNARAEQTKYEPKTSDTRRRWAFWQFVVLIVATFSILMWGKVYFSVPQLAVLVGLFYLGLLSVAALIEDRPFASKLEVARWVATLAAVPLIAFVS